jgi:translation initiation factor IF-1
MEELPQLIFRVDLGKGRQVLAHAAGMAERNFGRLLPGDKVEIELAPADATRGRILKKVE